MFLSAFARKPYSGYCAVHVPLRMNTTDSRVQPSPSPILELSSGQNLTDIREQLKKLERRDWWLWSLAVIVMLLLTIAVVSLSFPELVAPQDEFFQFSLNQAVRGLVGLVLLFNTYTIYQQAMIKRLRRQFSQQLDAMSQLNMRAEELHRLATTDPHRPGKPAHRGAAAGSGSRKVAALRPSAYRCGFRLGRIQIYQRSLRAPGR